MGNRTTTCQYRTPLEHQKYLFFSTRQQRLSLRAAMYSPTALCFVFIDPDKSLEKLNGQRKDNGEKML